MAAENRGEHKIVDLTQFDRSDEAALSHWRGFTKYQQPDGSVVACGSADMNGMGLALGPAASAEAADRLIIEFYER